MEFTPNASLKPYNTFGIDVTADYFVAVSSLAQLKHVLALDGFPNKLILGGGSNMLFTKPYKGLVIKNTLKGISIVEENDTHITIKANAGENWHEFVLWCIDHNYGGLENLSLIPGNVGTAPIQNIGAYGIEIKDTFLSCEALHIKTLETQTFSNADCKFGYRQSVFKSDYKGQYIITSVVFKLTKNNHKLSTQYGAIDKQLELMQVKTPSIKTVSDAVIAIRKSKLPDPNDIGNSGSFFKNPIISTEAFKAFQSNFPEAPSYNVSESEVKVPAGWLIDQAGFKGKTFGNYGVHKNQALVLVNYGGAKGHDIFELAKHIQKVIFDIFNITIETEVNII